MSREMPYTGDIARLHAEWEEIHSRLRLHEQALSDAIGMYVRGEGPRPQALAAEIEEMRAICGERFRALMRAIKAQ
jgi:hypothetical protein